MYHTSPQIITNGLINNYGIAGSSLFFSDKIYIMSQRETYYVYEANFNCIHVSQLYNKEIIEEIASYFECNEELAESLLDAKENEWLQEFECSSENSWWLQGKRGQCAVEMGYDGCEDLDEQGVVYIVPMKGRENELKIVENK